MDLLTGSPGFSAYIIAGRMSNVNHYRKRERMINWCLLNICCHCEPVRLSGVAIPRLEGKCIEKYPEGWETLRFLVVIVT